MNLPDQQYKELKEVIYFLKSDGKQDCIRFIETVATYLDNFYSNVENLNIKQSPHRDEDLFERLNCILYLLDIFFATPSIPWIQSNIHGPSAKLLITFLNITICCFKNGDNSNYFLIKLINHLKNMISALCSKARKARVIFVNDMNQSLWSLLLDKNSHTYLQLEVLTLLNIYTESSCRLLRKEIKDKWTDQFLQFGQMIERSGDYDLQSTILEYLFRFYRKSDDIKAFGQLFLKDDELIQEFTSIALVTFEKDIRQFLNNLNNKQAEKQAVFSVLSSKINAGDVCLQESCELLEPQWIDFNLGTGNVMFDQYSHTDPVTPTYVTRYIYQEEVSVAVLTLEKDPFSTDDVYRLVLVLKPIDLHPLNECHKSFNQFSCDNHRDSVQMYIKPSDPNISLLREKVLPLLYRDRFKCPGTLKPEMATVVPHTPYSQPRRQSTESSASLNSFYCTALTTVPASLPFVQEPSSKPEEALIQNRSLHRGGLVFANKLHDLSNNLSLATQLPKKKPLGIILCETDVSEDDSLDAAIVFNKKTLLEHPKNVKPLGKNVLALNVIEDESISLLLSTSSSKATLSQVNDNKKDDEEENSDRDSCLESVHSDQSSAHNSLRKVSTTNILTRADKSVGNSTIFSANNGERVPAEESDILCVTEHIGPAVQEVDKIPNKQKLDVDVCARVIENKATLSRVTLMENQHAVVHMENTTVNPNMICTLKDRDISSRPPSSSQVQENIFVFSNMLSEKKDMSNVTGIKIPGGNTKDITTSSKQERAILFELEELSDEIANKTLDIFASEKEKTQSKSISTKESTKRVVKVHNCLHSTDSKVATAGKKKLVKKAVVVKKNLEKKTEPIVAQKLPLINESKNQSSTTTTNINNGELMEDDEQILKIMINSGGISAGDKLLKTPQSFKRKLFTHPEDVIEVVKVSAVQDCNIEPACGNFGKREKVACEEKRTSERIKNKAKAVKPTIPDQSCLEDSVALQQRHDASSSNMDDFDRMCLSSTTLFNQSDPNYDQNLNSSGSEMKSDDSDDLEFVPKKAKFVKETIDLNNEKQTARKKVKNHDEFKKMQLSEISKTIVAKTKKTKKDSTKLCNDPDVVFKLLPKKAKFAKKSEKLNNKMQTTRKNVTNNDRFEKKQLSEKRNKIGANTNKTNEYSPVDIMRSGSKCDAASSLSPNFYNNNPQNCNMKHMGSPTVQTNRLVGDVVKPSLNQPVQSEVPIQPNKIKQPTELKCKQSKQQSLNKQSGRNSLVNKVLGQNDTVLSDKSEARLESDKTPQKTTMFESSDNTTEPIYGNGCHDSTNESTSDDEENDNEPDQDMLIEELCKTNLAEKHKNWIEFGNDCLQKAEQAYEDICSQRNLTKKSEKEVIKKMVSDLQQLRDQLNSNKLECYMYKVKKLIEKSKTEHHSYIAAIKSCLNSILAIKNTMEENSETAAKDLRAKTESKLSDLQSELITTLTVYTEKMEQVNDAVKEGMKNL